MRPLGASSGYKVSACRAAQASDARLYLLRYLHKEIVINTYGISVRGRLTQIFIQISSNTTHY